MLGRVLGRVLGRLSSRRQTFVRFNASFCISRCGSTRFFSVDNDKSEVVILSDNNNKAKQQSQQQQKKGESSVSPSSESEGLPPPTPKVLALLERMLELDHLEMAQLINRMQV